MTSSGLERRSSTTLTDCVCIQSASKFLIARTISSRRAEGPRTMIVLRAASMRTPSASDRKPPTSLRIDGAEEYSSGTTVMPKPGSLLFGPVTTPPPSAAGAMR